MPNEGEEEVICYDPYIVKTPLTVPVIKDHPTIQGKKIVEEAEVDCGHEKFKDELLTGYKATSKQVLQQTLKDRGKDGIEIHLGKRSKTFPASNLPHDHVKCDCGHPKHFWLFIVEKAMPKLKTDELPISGNVPHEDE